MEFDKSTATHIWSAYTEVGGYFHQLFLYKKVGRTWWVFSEVTGWRPSENEKEWFQEEKKLGYFRKLTKDEHNGLAEGNQQA